jgi:hypothetical protein
LGAVIAWHMDDARRVRRGLKVILKGEVHDLLVARGRGHGFGFNYTLNLVAVAWESGAWGLVYRLDELLGAELIVDGYVAARAQRGEARRALDRLDGAEDRIALRLVFDDATRPDFVVDFWMAEDEDRHGGIDSQDAMEDANRWIARIEAMLRRTHGRPTAPPAAARAAPPATALFLEDDVDEAII